MKVSKRTRQWTRKALNLWVVFMMLLQPISTPGILVAIAEDTSAVLVDSVVAPDATPKENPVVKKDESVLKTASDETLVAASSAPEKKADAAPIETPAVVSIPAPEAPSASKSELDSAAVEAAAPEQTPEIAPAGQAMLPVSEVPKLSDQPATGAIDAGAASTSTEKPQMAEDPIWKTSDGGNKAETKDVVNLNTEYKFPGNENVIVKFTKLPENPGKLLIEEITLSDEQVAQVGAFSNKAYDITSDMVDKTFEYTMTLPADKVSGQDSVGITYAEKMEDLSAPEKMGTVAAQNVSFDSKNGEVTSKNLDHFTVYIVVKTYANSAMTVERSSYFRGETVYAKSNDFSQKEYLKIQIKNPQGTIVNWAEKYAKSIDASYELSSNAPIGTWKVELLKKDGCNYIVKDTAEFTVKSARFGKIVIKKHTISNNEKEENSDSFTFDPSWSHENFQLSNGQSHESENLVAGHYSVREFPTKGWDLTAVSCGEGINPAVINLHAGETVVCIFTNTKRGEITIKKDAIPDDSQEFSFFGNFGENRSEIFQLIDDGEKNYEHEDFRDHEGVSNEKTFEVKPGSDYSVSENQVEGWKLADVQCSNGNDISAITVEPGQHITCTFTNKKLGQITLVKETTEGNGTFGFNMTGISLPETATLTTLDGAALQTFDNIDPDNIYEIAEVASAGWDLQSAECVNEKGDKGHAKDENHHWFSQDDNHWKHADQLNPANFEVNPGGQVTCTFRNSPNGVIHGQKWEDLNGDGKRNSSDGENGQVEEKNLADWTIFLDENGNGKLDEGEKSTVTSSDENTFGQYSFEHLAPATYSVCEVLQEGWYQTYPGGQTNCHSVVLPESNQQVTEGQIPDSSYDFGNAKLGSLSIEKTNDASSPKRPGEKVKYTLKVTALEGKINHVSVTDLPPAGFAYVSGSGQGAPFIHEYASPGVWDLGTMAAGQVKTLTYEAAISPTLDPGLYNDTAFATGTSEIGAQVLANEASQGVPFVGTQVSVIEPIRTVALNSKTVVETETKNKTKTKKKYVLATSLPETGTNNFWTLFGMVALIIGGALLIIKKRRMQKNNIKTSVVAVVAFMSLLIMANGAEAAVSVQVQQPSSTISSATYPIGFVVLGTDPSKEITVKCFRLNSGTDVQIGSDIVLASIDSGKASGNSGSCLLDAATLPNFNGGKYKFYVTASDGVDDATSVETTDVIVDVVGPEVPLNYARVDVDSCNKQIAFTTANDGQTVKTELYRSTEISFAADSATIVASQDILPNVAGSFSDVVPDCNQAYHYVIRALDENGNSSAFVGDENVTVTTETKTKTHTKTRKIIVGNNPVGAIAVGGENAAGAAVAAAETTNSEQATQGTQQGNGSVLGEETTTGGASGFAKKALPWVLLIAAAGLVWRAILKRKKHDEPKA
ncbi:MAG: LPXTG cell wall anchor domain-containing protein [Candidatus Moraniibacteriota bacterium]